MDGWNSSMSKQMKLRRCLLLIDLNQSITAVVFFHWCKLCFFAIVLLMRSRIFLLTFPISDFVGLMSLHKKHTFLYTN